MNPWGRCGKEYYSWHIENIDELEEFIIQYNINVDHMEDFYLLGFEKFWYSLKHQIDRRSKHFLDDDNLHLTLVSFSNHRANRRLSFTAIRAVVF
jgi:hypothetical protein